jgi:hypothetical protein
VAAVRVSRARADARMIGLAALLLVTGVVAIARADDSRAYTFQWRAVLAAFLVVTCVWAMARAMAPRLGRAGRVAAVAVAVAVVAWGSIAMTVAVVRRPSALLSAHDPDLRALVRGLERQPLPARPIRVRMADLPDTFFGVVNELERRGVDVQVDPRLGRVFGEERAIARASPATTWYVTERGSRVPGLLSRPGARLVASTSPLAPGEDRELASLQQRVGRALDAVGQSQLRVHLDSNLTEQALGGVEGLRHADLRRLDELNTIVVASRRCRCAIVEVPRDRVRPA